MRYSNNAVYLHYASTLSPIPALQINHCAVGIERQTAANRNFAFIWSLSLSLSCPPLIHTTENNSDQIACSRHGFLFYPALCANTPPTCLTPSREVPSSIKHRRGELTVTARFVHGTNECGRRSRVWVCSWIAYCRARIVTTHGKGTHTRFQRKGCRPISRRSGFEVTRRAMCQRDIAVWYN